MASNDPPCKCLTSHYTPHRRSKCTLTNNKQLKAIANNKHGQRIYQGAEMLFMELGSMQSEEAHKMLAAVPGHDLYEPLVQKAKMVRRSTDKEEKRAMLLELAKWVVFTAIPETCHQCQQASPTIYNYSITKYLRKYRRDKEQLEAHHYNVSYTHYFFTIHRLLSCPGQ